MTKNTNTMKASELMIGDWVLDTYTNKPMRMEVISRDMGEGLEPISLTHEILEKNGFRVRSAWAEYEDDDCTIELFGANISIKNGRGPWFRGKWSFVHELQHALRLCGIDKEIEL